jgi:hypothetical protein
VGGLCVNEMINYCGIKGHRNIINLVLVWNYGQEVFSVKWRMLCYYSSQTHINKCVLVVGMHWNEHGGKMCHDFWV